MTVMLNSALKRFDLITADLDFIYRQLTFQPLDLTGQPIGPPLDANGDPLPGTVTYDPSGAITITATLPDGSTQQYTYDSAYDPSGLRHIDGSVNNLLPGQGFFGHTSSDFLHVLGSGYGTYLGQYVPAAGEDDSAAHPYASALDTSTHHFTASQITAQPNYAITADATTGDAIVHTVIDYTAATDQPDRQFGRGARRDRNCYCERFVRRRAVHRQPRHHAG